MNIKAIDDRLSAISTVAADGNCPEAHLMEDQLHLDFIAHIARTGPPDLAAMAKEILKSVDIKFDRWYE
jgi:hypothetical protein